jgi:alkanesulfonate monooxygenase SsuD/methylene tetrahydromethanopterin reductase-like flavin-dependent oxidoreductase (luciferase family)
MAGGAITFMAGPRTLVDLTCPTIRAAAARADRAVPRVVAMVSVCVTDDVPAVQARAQRAAESMAHLPSYAAMLQREGGPPLIAGPEDEVVGQLQALEDAGVSDLIPVPVAKRGSEDEQRTGRLLHDLRRASPSGDA